jgi:3-oxoacyl-[acyl-carrier-protein] synthase-3
MNKTPSACKSIGIIGVGHHLPNYFQDNDELCKNLAVTPDWVLKKTGIKGRRIAGANEFASDYATTAAKRAIQSANIDPEEIGLVIACTFSSDYIFPPMASKVHHNLGVKNAQVFDVQVNCAGFVTGLTIAADRMKSDPYIKYALVIGVEFNSRYIDKFDENTAVYLGDGAGAAILGRVVESQGILASSFFTDSSNYEGVRMRGGGSSYREMDSMKCNAFNYMEMNGIATWRQAITHLPSVIRDVSEKANLKIVDIDLILFHQANYNLIEYIVKKIGLNMDNTYTNVKEIGNTGAASLAIVLSEANQLNKIKKGDNVLLAAVGAGFTFGASIWRWSI